MVKTHITENQKTITKLIEEFAESLHPQAVEQIKELVQNNECVIALENLCTHLEDNETICSNEQMALLNDIANRFKIPLEQWELVTKKTDLQAKPFN